MSRELVNGAISLGIVLSMLLIYLNVLTHSRPVALVYQTHPSTTMAFLFFGTAWIFVLALYAILFAAGEKATLAIWLLDNVSKLCLFATALAYSRGKQFNVGTTIAIMVAVLILLSLWEIAFWWLATTHPDSMMIGALKLAPDVMLSGIGIVLIGWVFFVRWGGLFGWFFLLVTIAYSVLQLPATLQLGFDHFLTEKITSDLEISFSFLAGGKILLAFGFLSLICESSEKGLEIDQPRTWPKEPVSPPRWLFLLGGWIGSFLTAILVGVIAEKLKDKLLPDALFHFFL